MNAYAADILLHQERSYRLDVQPLEDWFRLVGERPALRRPGHHGPNALDYGATWTLDDEGFLRLVSLAGTWPDGRVLRLGHLFPLGGEAVVAGWYSGRLHGTRLGDPHRIDARHGDLRLELQAGRLVGMAVEAADPGQLCDAPYWAASLV